MKNIFIILMLLISSPVTADSFHCKAIIKNGKHIIDLNEALSIKIDKHSDVTRGLAIEVTYKEGGYSVVDEHSITEAEKDLNIINETLKRCIKLSTKTM